MSPPPRTTNDPPPGAASAALRAVSEAMLGLAGEPSLGPVLERLVHAARDLVGARYTALGIPDGEGGFDAFITVGMSDELIDAIGPLPFTAELVTALVTKGVVFAPIVLHCGVSSPEAGEAPQPERYRVPATTAALINASPEALDG